MQSDDKWCCCVAVFHQTALLHLPKTASFPSAACRKVLGWWFRCRVSKLVLTSSWQDAAQFLFLANYSSWIHLPKSKATSLTFPTPAQPLAGGGPRLLSHFNHFHLANEGLFSPCPEAHLFVLLHFITRLNVNWVFHIICAELMSHSEDFSQISCQGLRRCCDCVIARSQPYFSA